MFAEMNSPIGKIRIYACDKGIIRVCIGLMPSLKNSCALSSSRAKTLLERALKELSEYFAGEKCEFTVPVYLQGTSFELKVWNAVKRIPYGETRTYKDIAAEIGSPRAFRAVGNALSRNPIPILIPCHRVVRSNGKLGGYTAGIKVKRYLLELEEKYKEKCKKQGTR